MISHGFWLDTIFSNELCVFYPRALAIANVLRHYFTAVLCIMLIFIYSMIGLLICKYEPFWQEVNEDRVPDTQVTIKACRALVIRNLGTGWHSYSCTMHDYFMKRCRFCCFALCYETNSWLKGIFALYIYVHVNLNVINTPVSK